MVLKKVIQNCLSRHSHHGFPGAITMHSRGGIGNQLFIFCAAIQLAEANNCEVYVDSSQHQFTPALPFLLDQIIATFPEQMRLNFRILDTPTNWITRERLKNSIPNYCDYSQPKFSYDSKFTSVEVGSCIFGYFQSWKFINEISDASLGHLRESIANLGHSPHVPPWNKDDIVLHVRRGDYQKPEVKQIHGILGTEYYVEAVRELQQSGATGRVWIISEQPLKDIGNFAKQLDSEINQVQSGNLWEDLNNLIQAPNLVMANSTFSWMGGWLGPKGRKIVIPDPWFMSKEMDTRDLYPENWIKVRHEYE